ncbi:MAG: Arm DNA-binding domain-containing protein [Actinomycetota bacterium]|nr:Arm DNA-binding domain-containing protein [Actinomycetota bacterium]
MDIGTYADGRRRQHRRNGFETAEEAERALRNVVSAIDKQSFVEPSQLTLAEYLTEALAAGRAASAAAQDDMGRVRPDGAAADRPRAGAHPAPEAERPAAQPALGPTAGRRARGRQGRPVGQVRA